MTMIATARPFDPAQYLDDDKAIAAYMSEALETGDVSFIADALGVVARAKGMSQIANETNLSRESLYRALSSDGNPEFATVIGVMKALGLRLTASPIGDADPRLS
jgi:probable addiction module antidote protein